MIRIKAKIKLYKGENRWQTPFRTNYRPLFNFTEMKTSGQIILIDKIEFFPREEGLVYIDFLNQNYLGENINVGTLFTFDEGRITLGEGVIKEVISLNNE